MLYKNYRSSSTSQFVKRVWESNFYFLLLSYPPKLKRINFCFHLIYFYLKTILSFENTRIQYIVYSSNVTQRLISRNYLKCTIFIIINKQYFNHYCHSYWNKTLCFTHFTKTISIEFLFIYSQNKIYYRNRCFVKTYTVDENSDLINKIKKTYTFTFKMIRSIFKSMRYEKLIFLVTRVILNSFLTIINFKYKKIRW